MQLNKKEIYYLITLLVLSFIFFFLKLWGFSLFDVDEPRYAEAAREMIESNNWITPYFNYVVRFDKPVLFYWLIAISYKIFGVSEFAARLPSAIMATLIVFAVFFFGRKHINSKYGFISALVTITSIEIVGLARMSITDMTLAAFITFMLMAGFTAAHSEGKQRNFWWYAFYVFAALGMLTKGPVAPAFAVMVLGPYFILTGKFIEVLKTCKLFTGFLLFFLVASPWYIMVILENGQPYIDQFFLTDNLKRFTSTVSGHDAPIYFFFIVVLIGFIPWSTFLPYALIKYLKPVFAAYKQKSTNIECNTGDKKCSDIPGSCPFIMLYNIIVDPIRIKYKDTGLNEYLIFFSLLWFIIIFTFFSLSGTKLLTYILPLFPALSLIVGYLWYEYLEKEDSVRDIYMLISCGVLVLIFLVVSYLFVFQFYSLMPRDAKVLNLGSISVYAALVLSLGSIIVFIFIFLKKKIFAFSSMIIMMIAIALVALYGIVPKVNYAAQGHLNQLINVANNYPDGKHDIITYGLVKPSIVFYTQRKIHHVEDSDEKLFKKYLNTSERIFIITRVKYLDQLSKNPNVYIINSGRRFALFTNKPFEKKITKKLLQGNKQ
ncbi:MAG: glycosyltransferase family 39 protein [Cyanobacteriota bacterium]